MEGVGNAPEMKRAYDDVRIVLAVNMGSVCRGSHITKAEQVLLSLLFVCLSV